jgi:hypothetical protein
MLARTLSVVIVMLGGILAGCSKSSSSKPGEEKGEQAKGTPTNSVKNKSSGSEDEARSVLKAALDSWAFGDPIEKYENAHPGVSFFDTNWITKKRLGRYEIGNVRQDGMTFEFLVTLTFREDSGDVTKSGDYHVTKDADGWVITAGSR